MSPHQPLTKVLATADFTVFCYGPDFVVADVASGDIKVATYKEGEEPAPTFPSTVEHRLTERHSAVIHCLAHSPAAGILATAADDKSLRLWRTSDWTCLHTFETAKRVNDLLFSPIGDLLYLADKFGDIYRINLADNTGLELPFLGQVSMTTSLALTPAADLIIGDRDEKIRICSAERRGDILHFCLGHSKFVSVVQAIPGTDHFISGGGDPFLLLWNATTHACLAAIPLPPQEGFTRAPTKGDDDDDDEEEEEEDEDEKKETGPEVASIHTAPNGALIITYKDNPTVHTFTLVDGTYTLAHTLTLPSPLVDSSLSPAGLLWIVLLTQEVTAPLTLSADAVETPPTPSTILAQVDYPTFVGTIHKAEFNKSTGDLRGRKRAKQEA